MDRSEPDHEFDVLGAGSDVGLDDSLEHFQSELPLMYKQSEQTINARLIECSPPTWRVADGSYAYAANGFPSWAHHPSGDFERPLQLHGHDLRHW